MIPLFSKFPSLVGALPFVPLAQGFSRVEELSPALLPGPVRHFLVKRDDIQGDVYGGNKRRKLEWLLAEALERECTEVLTFGAFGSHHTLATALYAERLGLRAKLILTYKPLPPGALKSLLVSHQRGATLVPCRTEWGTALVGLSHLLRGMLVPDQKTYLILPGGSTVRGCLGFVNAGLELAEQVRSGQLPEPSLLFVPVGSCGTMAGLLAGFRISGLRTRVIGVRVADSPGMNARGVCWLANRILTWLQKKVGGVSFVPFQRKEVTVVEEFLGEGYSHPTEAGEAAMERLEEVSSVPLEPVYTAKAMAGMMDWAKKGTLEGESVLFWNTYNALPLPQTTTGRWEPKDLPGEFHAFFSSLPRVSS